MIDTIYLVYGIDFKTFEDNTLLAKYTSDKDKYHHKSYDGYYDSEKWIINFPWIWITKKNYPEYWRDTDAIRDAENLARLRNLK